MAGSRESSGLLSLTALREEEKKRAHERAQSARLRAEAEQRTRLAAQQERSRIEQQRREAEPAVPTPAEGVKSTEQASDHAIAREACERARELALAVEALQHSVETERALRRESEQGLRVKVSRQRQVATLSVVLACGSWLGAAALYWGPLRSQAEHAASRPLESRASPRAERDPAGTTETAARHDELAARIARLEQKASEARAGVDAPKLLVAPHGHSTTPKPGTARLTPCRDDGDPLNPCLKH